MEGEGEERERVGRKEWEGEGGKERKGEGGREGEDGKERTGEGGTNGAVPDDLEATMVSSGPASSLQLGGIQGDLGGVMV